MHACVSLVCGMCLWLFSAPWVVVCSIFWWATHTVTLSPIIILHLRSCNIKQWLHTVVSFGFLLLMFFMSSFIWPPDCLIFLSLTAKQKNLLFTSNLYFSSSQSSNQASLCCVITCFTLISVCLWDCPEHVWEEAVSSITSDIWDSCMSSGRCLKRGVRWCCV